MLVPLVIPPDGSQSLLQEVRQGVQSLDALDAWSSEGQHRWGTVLGLALPPLPVVNARFDIDKQAWRGVWTNVSGVPALWCQERASRDELRPWVLVPLERVMDAKGFWGTWLDHLALSFSRLSPKQARQSCPQVELAGRLSGPAWALLSGRCKAAEMLMLEDLCPLTARTE